METIPMYGTENSRMVKFSDMCECLFYLNGWPNNRLIRITTYSYRNIPTVYLYIGNQNDLDNGGEPITLTFENVQYTRNEYIQLVDIGFKIGSGIPDYWRLDIDSQFNGHKRITFVMRDQSSNLIVQRSINTEKSVIQVTKNTDDADFSWKTVHFVNLVIHE